MAHYVRAEGQHLVFAYVDETGNTGAKLLDDEQPLFITAALLTRSDFDLRFAKNVRLIAESLGETELHANKLGVGKVETVARDLLRVLRASGPAFFLARVEKKYVIAAKVYDTLFDSFENKAVPWHLYNLRPLRMVMVFKVASLLDFEVAEQFYDALLDNNNDRAWAKMAEVCRNLRERVPHLPDARSREIFGDGLAWAAENPEQLRFVHSDKIGRKGHLPNMIGFGNLLSGIEQQSNKWGRAVQVIRHDRQHEFAKAMQLWHELYANARDDVVSLPLGEKMVLRKVFGSKLEISSAADSAGIQVIDTILWLFARSLKQELPPGCQAVLDYVYQRAWQDDFSFAGVGDATAGSLAEAEANELSDEDLERARALQLHFEEQRKSAMADLLSSKTTSVPTKEV